MTILLFFIMLGALVFVHELGHFLSAKKAGIRVDEFALGFPPRVMSKKVGETVYALNLIPFGGYVKIFGEDGAEAGANVQDDARAFIKKPKWVQATVLCSGVLGNIIFAWLLLSATFLVGVPSSADGRYGDAVQEPKLTITSVLSDSPAGRAGLEMGDIIWSITEEQTEGVFRKRSEGYDAESARVFIGHAESPLTIQYERGAEMQSVTVVPKEGIIIGKKAIGVTLDAVGVVRFGIFRSVYEGFLMTLDLLREITMGLVHFVGQAFLGNANLGEITGPVGIAGLVGEARILGFVYLLSFTAFISLNLAVINLLPLPALDGGRLLFLGIEAILRRPLPERLTRVLNTTGFCLLLLVMFLITYRDIMKML